MTDDNDSLESQVIKEIESVVFKKIFFILLAGAVAFGSWIGLGGVRPNPFTSVDGDALALESKEARAVLLKAMEAYTDREVEFAIILLKTEMPPVKAKMKIRALERSAERVDPEFEATLDGW